jgi:hypothetical protein
MSSIKPPGGKPPIDQSGPSQAPEGAEATGPSFGDALQSARQAQAAPEARPTEAGAQSGATEPIAELADALERGELNVEQALERLLEHSLAGVDRQLSAEQRGELLAMLRSALEHDPALAELKAHLVS